MQVTIRQLRAETKAILRAIEHGKSVIITSHGEAKAKLTPIKKHISKPDIYEEVFGMWKSNDKTKDVNQFIKSQRASRKIC